MRISLRWSLWWSLVLKAHSLPPSCPTWLYVRDLCNLPCKLCLLVVLQLSLSPWSPAQISETCIVSHAIVIIVSSYSETPQIPETSRKSLQIHFPSSSLLTWIAKTFLCKIQELYTLTTVFLRLVVIQGYARQKVTFIIQCGPSIVPYWHESGEHISHLLLF